MFKIECSVGFNNISIGSLRSDVQVSMESFSTNKPDSYHSTGFDIDEYESIGVTLVYLTDVLNHIVFNKPAVVSLHGVNIKIGKARKSELFDNELNIDEYVSDEALLYSDQSKVIFSFKNEKQKSKIQCLEVISTTFEKHSESLRNVLDSWSDSHLEHHLDESRRRDLLEFVTSELDGLSVPYLIEFDLKGAEEFTSTYVNWIIRNYQFGENGSIETAHEMHKVESLTEARNSLEHLTGKQVATEGHTVFVCWSDPSIPVLKGTLSDFICQIEKFQHDDQIAWVVSEQKGWIMEIESTGLSTYFYNNRLSPMPWLSDV